MKIKVEATWNGRQHGFRLTTPDGKRESLQGDTWTRKLAKEALDLYEHAYGFKRASVRFEHR